MAGVGAGAADGGGWSGARAWAAAAAATGGGTNGCGGWLEGLVPAEAFNLVLTLVGVLLAAGAAGGTAAGGDGSEDWPAGRTTAELALATGGGGALVTAAVEEPGRLASSKLRLPAVSGAEGRG